MSHVEASKATIPNDLPAIRRAVELLAERSGLRAEFCEGQRTYKWFGTHIGDYPLPPGMRIEDLGKCHHAIRVDGSQYEIGLIQAADGKFRVIYDFFDFEGSVGLGRVLDKFMGDRAGNIFTAYVASVAIEEKATKQGLAVEREVHGDKLRLRLKPQTKVKVAATGRPSAKLKTIK
jgi:hypothetical protein